MHSYKKTYKLRFITPKNSIYTQSYTIAVWWLAPFMTQLEYEILEISPCELTRKKTRPKLNWHSTSSKDDCPVPCLLGYALTSVRFPRGQRIMVNTLWNSYSTVKHDSSIYIKYTPCYLSSFWQDRKEKQIGKQFLLPFRQLSNWIYTNGAGLLGTGILEPNWQDARMANQLL